MNLIEQFEFSKNKGIKVTWLDNELGDMQRAFQTIRELLYNQDEEKKSRMLEDFSVYNKAGVDAARQIVGEGFFERRTLDEFTVEEVFDELMDRLERD